MLALLRFKFVRSLSVVCLFQAVFSLTSIAAEPESSPPRDTTAKPALALDELRLFAEIFGRIKDNYVEEVSDKELLENAIKGMLSGLDPHSAYFSEDEYERLSNALNGKYKGIGVELVVEAPYLKVVVPIEGGPAEAAGVLAGDLVTHVDGVSVLGLTLTEVLNRLQGELGSAIQLTLLRNNEEKVDVTVVRSLVVENTVRHGMLAPGYGYVRVRSFAESTGKQFKQAISKLEKQTRLSGLVVDLRSNPGGALGAAVEVADTLLDKGVIVSVLGRNSDMNETFKATSSTLVDEVNVIVLIDESSASASEIVAAALQDHKRAILLGQQSYGKGSVQSVVPINGKSGFKMTTARYYTPSGRSIQAVGVTPDVFVEPATIQKKVRNANTVNERQLDGHLRNEDEEETAKSLYSLSDGSIDDDFQLFEALNLLKALSVVSNR